MNKWSITIFACVISPLILRAQSVSKDTSAWQDVQPFVQAPRVARTVNRPIERDSTSGGTKPKGRRINSGARGRTAVTTQKNICKTFYGQLGEIKTINGTEFRVITFVTESLKNVDLPEPIIPTLNNLVRVLRGMSRRKRSAEDFPGIIHDLPTNGTSSSTGVSTTSNAYQSGVPPYTGEPSESRPTTDIVVVNRSPIQSRAVGQKSPRGAAAAPTKKPAAEDKASAEPVFEGYKEVKSDRGINFGITFALGADGVITFDIRALNTTNTTDPYFRNLRYIIEEKETQESRFKTVSEYVLTLHKILTEKDVMEIKQMKYVQSLVKSYVQAVGGKTQQYDFDTIVNVVWKFKSNQYRVTEVIFRSIREVDTMCSDLIAYCILRTKIKKMPHVPTASFLESRGLFYDNMLTPTSRFLVNYWYLSHYLTIEKVFESLPKFDIQETVKDTKSGRVQMIKVIWQANATISRYTTIAILYSVRGGDPKVKVREYTTSSKNSTKTVKVSKIIFAPPRARTTQEVRLIDVVRVEKREIAEQTLEDAKASTGWIDEFLSLFNDNVTEFKSDVIQNENYTIGRIVQPDDKRHLVMVD